jgi:glycosyltransferase involved in cell wall biosynthesis
MTSYTQKTKERKIKVLVIDQNSVQHTARSKWDTLAKCENIQLNLVTPKYWKENYNKIYFQIPKKMEYKIFTGSVIWPGFENRSFFLTGLIKAMCEFKPDLIFLFEEPFSFFALQTILLKKIICPKTKLIFYTWDNLTWENNYPYKFPFIYKLLNKFTQLNAEGAIAANIEAIEIIKQKGFIKPVSLIYYPIDLNYFNIAKKNDVISSNPPKPYFTIGYVGRFLKQKGIDILYRACSKLDIPFKLLMVGDGPDIDYIKRLEDELELEGKIIWYNSVLNSNMPELYSLMDILVLPSKTTLKWKEQFGRVLVEAMAMGVIPLGSSSGAIPEVIGDAGLIFPEGDFETLSKLIKQLYLNANIREELINKGSRRVKEFSLESFSKKCSLFIHRITYNLL